jgi:RHS repeat-associated protein
MTNFEQRMHDNNKGDLFSYDELNRLTNIKFNSPEPYLPDTTLFEAQKTLQFDKLSNINKIQTPTPSTSEITNSLTNNNFQLNQYTTFDQWSLSYDLNGNTIQKGTQQFTYDYRNQLIEASDLTSTTTFLYDPFGRRIQKSTTSGTFNSTPNTINYLYAGNQVIEERDQNNQLLKQYIYGNSIDELFRQDINQSGTLTPYSYYIHTDHIGSTTAITTQNGTLQERISYDLYGSPTFKAPDNTPLTTNASTIGNTTLFQGRTYDSETNLYYYRARYLDPIMGRFLQTDPLGYKDSLNLYQAFNQNPVNYLDPKGEYFIVPYNDKYRKEILNALAKGALTKTGSSLFWNILLDPRPVIVKSGNLNIAQRKNTTVLTFGEVFLKDIKRTSNRVTGATAYIDLDKLKKFSYITKKFNFGQGRVDKGGITTTYHELKHVSAYLTSAPWNSKHWSLAHTEAFRQDLPASKGASHSSGGSSQLFGETVYKEFKSLKPSKKAIKSLINLIEVVQKNPILRLFIIPNIL